MRVLLAIGCCLLGASLGWSWHPAPGSVATGGAWPGHYQPGAFTAGTSTGAGSTPTLPAWPRMGYHAWTGSLNSWMQPTPAFQFFDPTIPRFSAPMPPPAGPFLRVVPPAPGVLRD